MISKIKHINIKGRSLLLCLVSLLSIFTIQSLCSNKVSAAYDGGRIIDDSVFLDAQSMNQSQIQSFLSSKGAGLANMSFTLNCYGQDSKERQWYTAVGAPCDQSVSASHIIYYASQIYGVSPKVILSTMQKEQSLTTAPNPTSWQLNQAMGYACPTSGQCGGNSTFPYQIDSGTWVLRYHFERARGNNNWWNPSSSWTCGTEKNFYKPNLYPGQNVNFYDQNGTLYRTHYIYNAATSSFYCYTPHAYNNPQGLYGRTAYGHTGMYYSGSYNFVHFFEMWFGSTLGENYFWAYEGHTVHTDNTKTTTVNTDSVNENQRMFITVKAKNLGHYTWYKEGSAPMRLGTYQNSDRLSPFCDSSWISCSRAATLKESSVSPGQTGTFEFWVKAPAKAGFYNEGFNLVADGYKWLNNTGFYMSFNVEPNYRWEYISQSAHLDQSKTKPLTQGSDISTGRTVLLTLRARNTGTKTWLNNGQNPIRLGTNSSRDRLSPFCDSSWISCSRAATLKESSVSPGQTGTFEFWVKYPEKNTTYNERFNLVAENASWFDNDNGLYFTLNVTKPSYTWSFVSQSAHTDQSRTQGFSGTASKRQKIYMTLVAKNTGNTTWYKASQFPLRLSPSNPYDRLSPFCDSSWISCGRIVSMNESKVEPGDNATFRFEMIAPNINGDYKEYLNLVAENASWLNNIGLHYSIKIQ